MSDLQFEFIPLNKNYNKTTPTCRVFEYQRRGSTTVTIPVFVPTVIPAPSSSSYRTSNRRGDAFVLHFFSLLPRVFSVYGLSVGVRQLQLLQTHKQTFKLMKTRCSQFAFLFPTLRGVPSTIPCRIFGSCVSAAVASRAPLAFSHKTAKSGFHRSTR